MHSPTSIAACFFIAASTLATAAGTDTDAENSHTILLIWGQAPESDYVRQINEGFREGLARAPTPPTLFTEYLDELRFGDRVTYGTQFLDWLQRKYQERRIDLIAVTAQDSLLLLANRPPTLWPGAPLVYETLGHLTVELEDIHSPVSGLVLENYFPAYLDVIKAMLPQTRRIALISGTSGIERERAKVWSAQIRTQRLEVIDLAGLSLGDLLDLIDDLPDETVVLHLGIQTDAAGHTLVSAAVTRMIAEAANRPVFTLDDKDVGSGTLGGPAADWRLAGHEYARHALERLDGSPPRVELLPAARYLSFAFDARQLARWSISERHLPADSIVRFHEPSLWRDYKSGVIVALVVGAMQTVLIIAVLLERRNRARAKAALSTSYSQLRNLTNKLITAQEQERTRIARDLHDDIGQRVASFSIALSRLRRLASDQEAREDLTILQQQAASLSTDLRHLSHDLHPSALEHLGLLEALRVRCDDLESESGVKARLSVCDQWREPSEMIELCLYRVALEVLRNVAQHAKSKEVVVSLSRNAGEIVMQVTYDGCGFDPSTSVQRLDLALVNLSERVRMLGGHFEIRTAPTSESTVTVRFAD